MENSNILKMYRNEAHNSFLNFEGYEEVDGYDEFTDSYPANGGEARAATKAPVSKPYVVRVRKTGGGDTTVTLFDAANALFNTNFNNPTNIIIESLLPEVTYTQMLTKLLQSQYRIGKTWIKCSNSDQLSQDLTVTYNNFKGQVLTDTILPTLDDYQYITTQLTVNDRINASSELKIVFTMLSASTSITFRFYPEVEINDVNVLNGVAPARGYAAPRLNQGPVIRLSTGATKALRGE